MPQNAGKHISESFKFQIFAEGACPQTPATRRACYASTIHFSLLLSSDQTPITFSIDNPEDPPNSTARNFFLNKLAAADKANLIIEILLSHQPWDIFSYDTR